MVPNNIESLFHKTLGTIKDFGINNVKKIVIIDKIKNMKYIVLLFNQKKNAQNSKKNCEYNSKISFRTNFNL